MNLLKFAFALKIKNKSGYCKGQKHVDFVKIVDSSLVELKFTVEEKISDIEFVIRNKSENGISIYSIELSGSEKRLRNEN